MHRITGAPLFALLDISNRVGLFSRIPYANKEPFIYSCFIERPFVNSGSIGNLVYATSGNYALDESRPVGNISYIFKVNTNGSSVFTIPLSLPQGQVEMTPELNIVYNSLAGEGVLGYGMKLSCISSITSITRCGKRSSYDGSNVTFVFVIQYFYIKKYFNRVLFPRKNVFLEDLLKRVFL